MNLLIATLIFSFVAILHSCSGQYIYPTDDFFVNDEIFIECPEACPAKVEPICTSNGFCIKLFDNTCQLVYFNCKFNREYRQIHQKYCDLPRFKNLQPRACFRANHTSTQN